MKLMTCLDKMPRRNIDTKSVKVFKDTFSWICSMGFYCGFRICFVGEFRNFN
jgi:hypothetical protein